jgi:hypothetical protein
MRLGGLLYEISQQDITLSCRCSEDRLNAKPTSAVTPELIAEIQEHKMDIIQIIREDEELLRTGRIQSERQVFELTREHSMNGHHPARKRAE